ncbi:MAG: hypothetical protein JNM94_01590 [Phycisphaerae bacterium]|nr:hypothetical protein [Phycisphaerae bacterium]
MTTRSLASLAGAALTISLTVSTLQAIGAPATPAPPALGVRYLVVWYTKDAGPQYRPAAHKLIKMHGASEFKWDGDIEALKDELLEQKPAHLALVLPPDLIDAQLVRDLAPTLARFDDDPFLDCRLGFITGGDGKIAADFVDTIAKASGGDIPDRTVSARIELSEKSVRAGPAALESAIDRALSSVDLEIGAKDPAWQPFIDKQRHELMDAGIVEIVDTGVSALRDFTPAILFGTNSLYPAIIFDGSSRNAATEPVDPSTVDEKATIATMPIVLEAIRLGAVAYVASVGAASPNRTRLEQWLILEGDRSIGDALRIAHDDLVIGALDDEVMRDYLVEGFRNGEMPLESVELYDDVALRVLFGDPAFVPFRDRRPSNHAVDFDVSKDSLAVTSEWTRLDLDPWVWDRWRADSAVGRELGRVYERIELPFGLRLDHDQLPIVTAVKVEATGGRRRQDVPATGVAYRELDPDGRSVLHVLVRGPRALMRPPGPVDPEATLRSYAELVLVPIPAR